ncbi:hypothetical protein [Thalassobacillus sp. CUG 92003]|uniref:hypothetical protein n=1 Tax=Thalassobacillus sp. CUG 92003 TaxID=2736641 RepID=UPI0015E68743|nr:hypothetical protein [Thalassobacillus sp. CUG 92003]
MVSGGAKRVYVSTFLFEGWAEITDYIPSEVYPYQITLDEPDIHGHRIKRVCEDDFNEKETII